MDDLVESIKASVENRIGDPWFPELTSKLTAHAWDRLKQDTGLTPESYGTERVLTRNRDKPREIICFLRLPEPQDHSVIQIEGLSEECTCQYRKSGVSFYASDDTLDSNVLPCLEEAFAVLNRIPTLMQTIVALVRSIHLIKPDNSDHDISFSEPHVPFSIFVSVPHEPCVADTLRVAEAVVHEAMHLQLTLIEQQVPLTFSTSEKYYSPWRNEYRNAQGILHAIYVFTAIARALDELRLNGVLALDGTSHIHKRCIEITEQFVKVQSFRPPLELTPAGAALVNRLMLAKA